MIGHPLVLDRFDVEWPRKQSCCFYLASHIGQGHPSQSYQFRLDTEFSHGHVQIYTSSHRRPDLSTIVYEDSTCQVRCRCRLCRLVAGRTIEQAQSGLSILMRRVSEWMTANGFSLALEKTEVVILTRKAIPTLHPISIDQLTTESKPTVKYF